PSGTAGWLDANTMRALWQNAAAGQNAVLVIRSRHPIASSDRVIRTDPGSFGPPRDPGRRRGRPVWREHPFRRGEQRLR
ncbi:MAG TPA: hypothetical protein PKA07_16875, partial [Micropruina sp.]|nr:hypothetical protein [Micropruina sp.]